MEPRRPGDFERRRELGPRPEPGPPPVPEALAEPGRRRVRVPRRRQHGLRKRVTTFARSKPGRWTLITLACITVLLVGLIAQGFLSSSPSTGTPDAAATGGLSLGPSGSGIHPSKTAKTSASPSPSKGKVGGNDALQILRSRFPDNPLNHLQGAGVHVVTVEVDSLTHIPFVGYLVPTGLGSAYDTIKPRGSHWSMSEKALGKGYLAAIFIQSGKTGVPVTCTVLVDGKVTNTETTAGSYGRSVCLG